MDKNYDHKNRNVKILICLLVKHNNNNHFISTNIFSRTAYWIDLRMMESGIRIGSGCYGKMF